MAGMLDLLNKVERLLRDFHQDLRRSLVGGNRVEATIKRWEPKRKALETTIKQAERMDPFAKLRREGSLYVQIGQRLNASFQALSQSARRTASSRTPKDTSGLAGTYNKYVRKAFVGLAQLDLDKEAKKGISKGIEGLLKKYVGDKMPSDLRGKMSNALAAEVMNSPFTREAMFWAEEVVVNVATYLDRRLTISGEIGTIKKKIEGKALPPAEVGKLKAAVGPRAQAAVALDNHLKKAVEQTNIKFKAYFKLKPKFDLDPAVLFIKKIDADLGVEIKGADFQIKLGTAMTLTKPLTDPSLNINPYLRFDSKKSGTALSLGYKGDVSKLAEGTAYADLKQTLGPRTTLNLGYSGVVNNLGAGKAYAKLAVKINPNASLTAGYTAAVNRPGSGTASVGLTLRF